MSVIDDHARMTRLLKRTGFTATPAQVSAGLAAGFPATVSAILRPTGGDPGAAATPLPSLAAPPAKPGKGDAAAKKQYRKQLQQQTRQVTLWWLDRMVAAQQPWVEKRTLLWHGHWATSVTKVKSPAAMLAQNDTERKLGGGDFGGFARAMVVDPALMVWLDAQVNTKKAPNENLGRELMELFTLGVGHYTENDVRQAAQALTGWRVSRAATPAASFVPARHADGTQTILGVTQAFGADSLVNLLVSQPNSPRYLATRMWGWLVAPTPPSPASLDRIVAAYGAKHDLTAMFEAMLTDPAFADGASVLVRQPIEYVVGMLRDLNLRPSTLDKKTQAAVGTGLTGLGQVPFQPPSVGGWPVGAAWLTTSAARARLALAEALVRVADLGALRGAAASARPDLLAGQLGVGAWTPRTRSVLTGAANDPVELTVLALNAPEYVTSR